MRTDDELMRGGQTQPTQRQDTDSDPNRPAGTYDPTKPTAPTVPTAPSTNPASTPTAQTSIVQPASETMASAQGSYSQGGALPPTPYYSGHTAQTPDYAKMINDLYDKNLAAQRAQLDADYEAVMRQIDAAAGRIPQQYQAAGNDLNAQYERQRAATNEQMAANGLNVGAGSQAALAQNAGYQGAYGQLMQAQANAQADLERQRVEQEAAYQSAITQALKTNDYQRAVALMQEMKDQRNADLDKAKILAGYGDFSGYAELYGDDAANNMRQLWIAQNPQFAYMTGNLSADDYYKLTGQYAPGTAPQTQYVVPNGANNNSSSSDNRNASNPGRPGGTSKNLSAAATTFGGTNNGLSDASLNRMIAGLSSMPASAASGYVSSIVKQYGDVLTDAQKTQVYDAARKAGIIS